ncbi:MAG: helix-turn-helix transcriptional regulator [Geobacteraceae bacterium]|nr:helix-turn-helix transcriptional regulator [Geobacteraceae bacterium]
MVTKEDIDNRVRYNLIRLRQEVGLSQTELVKWSGIAHIPQIESGASAIGKNVIARLANVLDVDVLEFFQPEEGIIERVDLLSRLSKMFQECTPRGQKVVLRIVKSFREYETGLKFLSK